jgi:hypothetical protein
MDERSNIMVTFVNRYTETMLIDNAFNALQNYENNDSILRTPIIDFFGVDGIGKTAILRYIREKCQKQKISCIAADASLNAYHFSSEVVRQVAKLSKNKYQPLEKNEDPFQRSLDAAKSLLSQGIMVLVLDNVDATNKEMLQYITAILRAIIDDRKLLVVLAGKKDILFDSERSISRKLTSLQVKALDRKSCEQYLDIVIPSLETETRRYVLNWTRGYPLAMEVMTKAIVERKLDPAQPENQKVLVDLIVKRVIDEKVFADLTPALQSRYKEALMLLSIPRQFNLLIMQKLIKQFASDELKKGSNLASMKLPGSIKNDTGVLSWNFFKGGYVIDTPVRNIFLLKVRIEETERYALLHQFLADQNKSFAEEVTEVDRVQYLCEYLYHSAHIKNEQEFIQILQQVQQEINDITFETLDAFEAFETAFEKLLQDNEGEFLDILGASAQMIESMIYRHLAETNRRRARATLGVEHFYHLRKYFIYILKDPLVTDERSALTLAIQDAIAGTPTNYLQEFAREMKESESLKKALGKHFELFTELLTEII